MHDRTQLLPTALEGVHAWYARADEHMNDLRRVFQDWAHVESGLVMKSVRDGEFDDSGYGFGPSVNVSPHTTLPPRLSVLVGEVSQALRRALDYLVYQLAARDSGSLQTDTQFPIVRSKKAFAKARGHNLRGVALAHADALEEYQPFTGRDWTRNLQVVSNLDKHRHLTGMGPRPEVRIRHTRKLRPHGVYRTLNGFSVLFASGDGRTLEWNIGLRLTTDDDTSVFKLLDEIQAGVGEVIATFRPCFSGGCMHNVPTPMQSSPGN